LADVVVFPDGTVKVLDLAELSDAHDEGIIDVEIIKKALRIVHWLLGVIYGGGFGEMTKPVDAVDYP
jgi:hypothetical protein